MTQHLLALGVWIILLQHAAYPQVLKEEFTNKAQLSFPLGELLLLGEQGSWTGRISDGSYILANEEDNAVKYFYLQLSDGNPEISVDVRVSSGDQPGSAGILYGFSPKTKTYLALTLTRQRYTVWRRGPDGLRPTLSGALPRPDPNRLTIRQAESLTEFLVNGETVARILAPDVKSPGVGLIAIGKGEFQFDNLSISRSEF